EQPELYRWTDGGGSYVDAVFVGGKLESWEMTRPVQPE
ncbi:MAG: glycerate kinase, partial [Pseudomonadota bacterium]